MVAEGAPSATARRVAANRLAFERLEAPYGDPAADDRLARDISGQEAASSEGMHRYLRGRTAFFDLAVVNAMGRGVRQVVNVGAGYDGRSLRYAKPGVQWWEIDHPATQADKRARLKRLDITTDHVSFVPLDLRAGGLAEGLLGAGYEPGSPALMICEGVAVYLEPEVLGAALHELRSLAAPGTRLTISLGISTGSPEEELRRQRFAERVAAAGEPALNYMSGADSGALLASTRWRGIELSERAQRAGFVMAAPVWEPAVGSP